MKRARGAGLCGAASAKRIFSIGQAEGIAQLAGRLSRLREGVQQLLLEIVQVGVPHGGRVAKVRAVAARVVVPAVCDAAGVDASE